MCIRSMNENLLKVPEPYRKFKKVFSDQESKKLPSSCPWDHKIKLKPGAPPTLISRNIHLSQPEWKNSTSSSKNTLREAPYKSPKAPMPQPSSSSRRRTGNYDEYKTTGLSTSGPSKTGTPYLSSHNKLTTCEDAPSSP